MSVSVLRLLCFFNQWYKPESCACALPSFEPRFLRYYDYCCLCVIEVNFVFGIDSDVVCVGHFACAEQGMLYVWYNVYALCWLLDVVVEFVDHCCVCLLPKCSSKVLFDFIPVGIDGSEGLKALAVVPVLLIANSMLPSSTPYWRLFFLIVCCLLRLALFLLAWLRGREKVTCLPSMSIWLVRGAK